MKALSDAGVKYGFVPQKRSIFLPLVRALRGCEPLILHSHFATFDVSAVILKIARHRSSKVVWHFHSVAQLTAAQRLKDVIKVNILARSFGDLFISVAEGVYGNALDRGFPRDRLFLDHNGINVAKFLPDHNRQRDARAFLGASKDQTVFLLLGYDPIIKGADLFVKAAAKIHRESAGNCLFVIIGREQTREFVTRMSEFSELGATLRILEPMPEFSRVLSGVDVLVAASRSEGLSYAVLEAMASGKIVLCSDIPGVREVFGEVKGVWLFPTEDWQQLSELMRKAKNLSGIQQQALAHENSGHVAARHSVEHWAQQIAARYDQLLNKKW